MRGLKILTVVMGVLIVAGVIVLVVTIGSRLSAQKAPASAAAILPALLEEPAGTRIAQISAGGDRLTLLLQGGGPDRIVILDLAKGTVSGRMGLAR